MAQNPFGMSKEGKRLMGAFGTYGSGSSNSESGRRRPIDKNTRDAVWVKYIGNKAQGKCYCCRIRPIHITDFQVGHNKAVSKGGGDNISNLRPICGPCNRGMGTMSIEQYRAKYFGRAKSRTSARDLTKKASKRKSSRGTYLVNPFR